jgi:RHS repeat-associated protein
VCSSPFGASTTSGATTGNAQQFTGREDDHNGLHFYRARYYSPELQRFISEDPIEFAGGTTNLHQYVANDPVNRTDPLGMQQVVPGTASPSPGGIPWLPESLLEWLWDELTSGPPPGPYPPPLDKYSKDAQAKCEKSRRGCKPCIPPIGTIAYRLDDSPGSVPHYSKPLKMDIPAPHWVLFVMTQSPPDVVDPCRCHWEKLEKLPGGLGNGPTPSGTVPIAPPAGGGSLPIRAGGW